MRKLLALLLMVAVLAVVMTACSSSDNDEVYTGISAGSLARTIAGNYPCFVTDIESTDIDMGEMTQEEINAITARVRITATANEAVTIELYDFEFPALEGLLLSAKFEAVVLSGDTDKVKIDKCSFPNTTLYTAGAITADVTLQGYVTEGEDLEIEFDLSKLTVVTQSEPMGSVKVRFAFYADKDDSEDEK